MMLGFLPQPLYNAHQMNASEPLKPLLRKAHLSDSEAIQRLIQQYAKDGKMLARSLQYVVEHLRDFWVAEDDSQIVGACAFTMSQKDLAEIKSLTVSPSYHHLGIATALVKSGMDEVKALGIIRVFCLTYVPEFFEKLGFSQLPKEDLPHKIWTECINCPSFPDCGEIALIKAI